MKQGKEHKSNANYFGQKEWIKYTGFGLLIVGAALFLWGWSYISYLLSVAMIPAGLAILLIESIRCSNDNDITEYIQNHLAAVEIDEVENKEFKQRRLKSPEPEICEGYEYREGVMLKKGKKGPVHSSEYTKAIVYPMKDGICVSRHTISLIATEEIREITEIPYEELHNLEVIKEDLRLTFEKNTFPVHSTRLNVEYGEGKCRSRPCTANVQTEDFVTRVKRIWMAEQTKNNE